MVLATSVLLVVNDCEKATGPGFDRGAGPTRGMSVVSRVRLAGLARRGVDQRSAACRRYRDSRSVAAAIGAIRRSCRVGQGNRPAVAATSTERLDIRRARIDLRADSFDAADSPRSAPIPPWVCNCGGSGGDRTKFLRDRIVSLGGRSHPDLCFRFALVDSHDVSGSYTDNLLLAGAVEIDPLSSALPLRLAGYRLDAVASSRLILDASD